MKCVEIVGAITDRIYFIMLWTLVHLFQTVDLLVMTCISHHVYLFICIFGLLQYNGVMIAGF